MGLIVLVGALKMRRTFGNAVFRAVMRGYRDGRRAAWLPGQDWEALLGQRLETVRAELGIGAPEAYQLLLEHYAMA